MLTWAGERTGCKPGRGAEGKTPFVAAVETTAQGCPTRIKRSVIEGFRSASIKSWSRENLCVGSTVISDLPAAGRHSTTLPSSNIASIDDLTSVR